MPSPGGKQAPGRERKEAAPQRGLASEAGASRDSSRRITLVIAAIAKLAYDGGIVVHINRVVFRFVCVCNGGGRRECPARRMGVL